MSKTPTYNTWSGIIKRCNNQKNPAYNSYGGRGITVCEDWLKFENFYEDMGKKPNGLTIERIDNDKGYYKENCCWDTPVQQARNRRLQKSNKTGKAGVYWDKQRQKYRVRITEENKRHHIGRFPTIEQATVARKEAEQKYWMK